MTAPEQMRADPLWNALHGPVPAPDLSSRDDLIRWIETIRSRAFLKGARHDEITAAEVDALMPYLATRSAPAELVEAQWQPIETAPKDGTAVLVYFANIEWRDMAGEPLSFGQLRDHVERMEIGFYQDGTWHESGTAHDMFESWRDQTELPTHWMPLPSPPSALRNAGAAS